MELDLKYGIFLQWTILWHTEALCVFWKTFEKWWDHLATHFHPGAGSRGAHSSSVLRDTPSCFWNVIFIQKLVIGKQLGVEI